MGKRCREIPFEKLISLISLANSELNFDNSRTKAVLTLYLITKDLCKPRTSSSVTVRVKAEDVYGFYRSKLLVTLDVEKSQLSNQYLIVIKSISKL